VWYLKWKSRDKKNQVNYDCRACKALNKIEKQGIICFLEKQEQEVPYPIFVTEDDKGNPLPVIRPLINGMEGSELYDKDNAGRCIRWKESIVDDIYEYLKKMEYEYPLIPSFKFFQTYMGKICPESIVDFDALQVYRLETAWKEYGSDVLELSRNMFVAFETIRSASNHYENEENFRREQEYAQKTQGK
jgi:hypothetical protein